MKKFKSKMFLVFRQEDIQKFKKLVDSKGAIWEGACQIKFLNIWNQPVGTQYACIYHFYEDLNMEILC